MLVRIFKSSEDIFFQIEFDIEFTPKTQVKQEKSKKAKNYGLTNLYLFVNQYFENLQILNFYGFKIKVAFRNGFAVHSSRF